MAGEFERDAQEDGRGRPALATLLGDQFAALDDVRPEAPRAVEEGEVRRFAFGWPLTRADEVMVRTGHEEGLVQFRQSFLELIATSLAEVVEVELRRRVTHTEPSLTDGPRRPTLVFGLAPAEADADELEAIRNWADQVRRKARVQRALMVTRREELRRLRGEITRRTRREVD